MTSLRTILNPSRIHIKIRHLITAMILAFSGEVFQRSISFKMRQILQSPCELFSKALHLTATTL